MTTNKSSKDQEKEGSTILPNNRLDSNPQPPSCVELLRLLRDAHSDQLTVEVSGKVFEELTDISDKKVEDYILRLAAHLLVFTQGNIVTKTGLESVGVPDVKSVPKPLETPDPSVPQSPLPRPEISAGSTSDEPQPSISEMTAGLEQDIEAESGSESGLPLHARERLLIMSGQSGEAPLFTSDLSVN